MCLSWVCLAMLPSMKTKLAMGFVHTLNVADKCGNLSFIMRIKVKSVLCDFVIISKLVGYVEYSKLKKKHYVRRKAFILLLTLNYMVALICLG